MNRITTLFLLGLILVAASVKAEKILIPVAFHGEVAGAHGSRWTVELVGYNSAARYIQVKPFGTCGITCPALPANPKSFFTIWPYNPVPGVGMFLYITDPEHKRVTFNLRVRDVSRALETWGTEIPVIRESEVEPGRPVILLHVPNEPGFRVTLRIYDFPANMQAPVTVAVYDEGSGQLLREETITLSDFGWTGTVPSQITMNDFAKDIPAARLRLEISPTNPLSQIWAYANVTHNETQHVTTITPQ
jgi:hypothetical protein